MTRLTLTFLLAGFCIAAGVLLLVLHASEAIAGTLVMAGVAVLGREAAVQHGEKRESEKREREAQETTMTLRKELLRRESKAQDDTR